MNVMLSLMSVMRIPLPCAVYRCFGSFYFRVELGFLNYDDIYMYVVHKQFELLEFSIFRLC